MLACCSTLPQFCHIYRNARRRCYALGVTYFDIAKAHRRIRGTSSSQRSPAASDLYGKHSRQLEHSRCGQEHLRNILAKVSCL